MAATFSTTFIDDIYIKNNTPLGKSIDIDEVSNWIDEAQNVYTQELLGTPLYEDLMLKNTLGLTYSEIEWQLIDLFSKALAYWTVYMALPFLSTKIRNAGVASTKADYTEAADQTKMKYLREELKNMGEFWNTRTVNFLCNNSKSFPLYNAVSEDMYATTKQYDCDLYLDDSYCDLTSDELKFLKKYLS